MTANEYARQLLDDSAYQISKVFEGIPEELADSKVNEHSMSPREALAHLLECREAFEASGRGDKYEWGNFVPVDRSLDAMLAALRAANARIREGAAEADAKGLTHLAEFLFAHDYYHVGQAATFRLTFTPGWDPYSIYRQE